MRRLTTTLCLTLVVFIGSAEVSWSADFQKGQTAYQRGAYATALQEWEPLAEQGYAFAQFYLEELQQKIAERKPSPTVTADLQKGEDAYRDRWTAPI